MTDSLEHAWDFQEAASTHTDDHWRASGQLCVPPSELAVIRAARKSLLRRFYPFTSHDEIYFSTGPSPWAGDGDVLPVGIAPTPEGRYQVYAFDGAWRETAYTVALETSNAQETVACAEQLANERWPSDNNAPRLRRPAVG